MSLLKTVRAAQRYYEAETSRLAAAKPDPKTLPEFTVFEGVIMDNDTALVPVEQGHQPRRIDPAIVLFLEVATVLNTRLRLNSRESGKAEGLGKFHLRADIRRPGKSPLNMHVNRLIADPPIGRRVMENPVDFRNHLREGLRTEESPLGHGPTKSRTTRQTAIDALLEAFDGADKATRAGVSKTGLESLLAGLLELADARSFWRTRHEMLQVVLKSLKARSSATLH